MRSSQSHNNLVKLEFSNSGNKVIRWAQQNKQRHDCNKDMLIHRLDTTQYNLLKEVRALSFNWIRFNSFINNQNLQDTSSQLIIISLSMLILIQLSVTTSCVGISIFVEFCLQRYFQIFVRQSIQQRHIIEQELNIFHWLYQLKLLQLHLFTFVFLLRNILHLFYQSR